MPKNDNRSAPSGATLADLDRRWSIAVGTSKTLRRYVGGMHGRRFATDGGALVLITEDEFTAAVSPWRTTPGLAGDYYGQRSKQDAFDFHWLNAPAEIGLLDHRLCARYGATWISTHYIETFMRIGATVIRVGEDPKAVVVVPDFGVVMPCDLDAADPEGPRS